ncbi:hypothetical protein AW27_023045 [Streptomyces sp. PCS3-D2]|uniref:hypothetical protein n=1 Tax=Streptomyces sp. PCS3-D2 TaxID=1460244 RepID=UPI0004456BBE|nr:hypothetical protein [Streptomyces sp. PCS3-D2]WKV74122.1 hypothetical protein AW27_023045 [Streptomyces sp. PCS3-D2]
MNVSDQPHFTAGGAWLARVRNPATAHEYRTLIPSRRLRTERWAEAQTALAAARDAPLVDPSFWQGAHLYELTYLPQLLHRERAIAWAALLEAGGVSPFRGWRPGIAAAWERRGDRWRDHLEGIHQEMREQVIGFGESLAQVMTAADQPHCVDVEAYRDGFDEVNWQELGADVHKAAMTTLLRTPYGLLWLDNG